MEAMSNESEPLAYSKHNRMLNIRILLSYKKAMQNLTLVVLAAGMGSRYG
jgi:hypothetical protein